jgi:hypothetical protein
MMLTRTRIAAGMVVALLGPCATAAPARDAARPAAGRAARGAALEKELAIDVRSAPLADVVEGMAAAGGVTLRLGRALKPSTSTGAGDQRITLYADRASVGDFQHVVAALLRLQWTQDEPEARSGGQASTGRSRALSYTLDEDPQARSQASALRRRQANHFLNGVQATAAAVASPASSATYARHLRDTFGRGHPEFDARTLEKIDVDFLRQALLATPLTLSLRSQLTQSRWISFPLGWLDDAHAALMTAFLYGEPGAGAAEGQAAALLRNADALAQTGARLQYRLVFGDRWTDTLLVTQVGAPGNWRTAILPSILYRDEDGSAIYPESRKRSGDASTWRRLPPRFQPVAGSWDDTLVRLARAMKINVASDSYLRPQIFDIDQKASEVAGLPLRDALDRLCRAYGMFWWRDGDWYLFRSRTWVEEENVAVPDRFLRRWTESVRQDGSLSADDLDLLGTLGDEQIMTLNLLAASSPVGGVADGTGAVLSALDLDGAWLAQAGLLLFRSLAPAQRQLALNGGLPALWLAPTQQQFFAAVAAELGFAPEPAALSEWGFAIEQRFPRTPGERGPVSGAVSLVWRFGPALRRVAEVAVSDARLASRREEPLAAQP